MRRILALTALLAIALPAAAVEGYIVDIDSSQSQLSLTILGLDYSGDMDGSFHFRADPEIVDGAYAEITDFNATVEDINTGLAALRDMTVVSNVALPSWGDIDDPLPGDDHVYINQMLNLVVDAIYDPLFGSDAPIHAETELCIGGIDFCVEPAGIAGLDTDTLWFDVNAQGVIPAAENPLGTDIPFQVIARGQGVPDGTTGLGEFGPVAGELRVWPNPAREQVRFAAGASGPLVVELYDVSGRRVARIVGAGEALEWDRRGDDGRRLSAGVYLARWNRGAERGAGRVMLLR